MIKSRIIEVTEYYDECPYCGKEIKGVTSDQVAFNLGVHKESCRIKKENKKNDLDDTTRE